MKHQVGTRLKEKSPPTVEINKTRIREEDTQYHINSNPDWRQYSEEAITEWFDVVEEDEAPNG